MANYLKSIKERYYYFYLILLRSMVDDGELIFKLGRTWDIFGRFKSYPKGSILLYLCRVKDGYYVEYEMIKIFKKKFKQKREYGLEFFDGNINKMIECTNNVIEHMNQKIDSNFADVRNFYKNYLKFKLTDDDKLNDDLHKFIFENEKKYEDTFDDDDTVEEDMFNRKIPILRGNNIVFTKEDILKAQNINEHTYNEYITLNKNRDATNEQLYAVEKYLYKKNWNIDDIDDNFINNWFGKTYVLNNLNYLMNTDNKERELVSVDKINNKRYLKYNDQQRKQKMEMIKELINKFGYDPNNFGKNNLLTRIFFAEKMKESLDECKIFKNDSAKLFDVEHKNIDSIKSFMGYCNTILNQYGLIMMTHRKGRRDKKTKKIISECFYYLDYLKNIDNYALIKK